MEFPISQARLEELMDDNCFDNVQVRADYSGRSMYGRTCVAFVAADSRWVTQLWILLAGESEAEGFEPQDLMDIVAKEQKDSWGSDTIVYYPDVQFPKADDEDDLLPLDSE
jgi:hypothetical protein